jgi:uncharacterized YigZ family protein
LAVYFDRSIGATMTPDSDHLSDAFRAVAQPCGVSILVSGSKFIAWLAPAPTETAAEAVLDERHRRYPDATHHCWAYRVGRPDSLIERFSDAGEPSGTAGRPIADAVRHAGLENAVCVVTRYFGGTKLGTGGLARAYADAAAAAIGEAALVTRTVAQVVTIDFDHERTGPLFRALDEFGLHLTPGTYDARGHGTVRVPASRVTDLEERLHELARTGIDVTLGERVIV